MLILMLGMNIGVKLYFRQRRDRQRLAQLEKQNLSSSWSICAIRLILTPG